MVQNFTQLSEAPQLGKYSEESEEITAAVQFWRGVKIDN